MFGFGKSKEAPAPAPEMDAPQDNAVFDETPTGQDMAGEGEMAAPMGEVVSPEVSEAAVKEIEQAANEAGEVEQTDEVPMLDQDDEDTPMAA